MWKLRLNNRTGLKQKRGIQNVLWLTHMSSIKKANQCPIRTATVPNFSTGDSCILTMEKSRISNMLISFQFYFLFREAQGKVPHQKVHLEKFQLWKMVSLLIRVLQLLEGFLWSPLPWIQVGERIAFSRNAILHKRPRTPNFSSILFLSWLWNLVSREPFMEINVWYLEHLSSALGVDQHLRRKKMPDILLHYMKTWQVIYQILQMKGSMWVKQPWVQAKKCRSRWVQP